MAKEDWKEAENWFKSKDGHIGVHAVVEGIG